MNSAVKPPLWYWIVAALLTLWGLMGCYACIEQIKLGAAAMGPVDAWSSKYYAALPVWYNGVYAIATFGGLFGDIALLLKNRRAAALFWVSLAAIILMFGYAFIATDLIAHKGLAQVLPFPLIIALIGAFSIWLANVAAKKGWLRT